MYKEIIKNKEVFMELKILKDRYKVVKLRPNEIVPKEIFGEKIYSITKTEEELSIVVKSNLNISNGIIEDNWNMIKIMGTLDFALIGILSKITSILANANISIFALSTYNTDYILLKSDKLEKAIEVLKENGYTFR